MKQNNQNTNIPIMLDSENPSNLLHYEAHIKLMYQYAIVSFMFIVMVCFLPGCVGIQTIYPDSREFARVCKEAREKGELVGILYDEGLQPNGKYNFNYLYELYRYGDMGIANRKDYIFGEDRKESNVVKIITYADKEKINKMKKDIREIKGKKEEIVTTKDGYGITIKKDKKSLLKYLEKELFLLENYYGETIEERIDEKSLITKEEYFIKNKKTKTIAFKGISYNLYADRSRFISSNKDPAKIKYYTKYYTKDDDLFIEFEQEAVRACEHFYAIRKSNEPQR